MDSFYPKRHKKNQRLPRKQARAYPKFCVNAKASKKIKVIRGGEQGNIFAALTAAKTEILLTIRKFLLFE